MWSYHHGQLVFAVLGANVATGCEVVGTCVRLVVREHQNLVVKTNAVGYRSVGV